MLESLKKTIKGKEDVMTPTTIQLSKHEKAIYRTTTGIVCVIMIFSIINFIFNDHFPFPNGPEGAFVHLGLPRHFKIELTTAKILGVLALLIPSVPFKVKQFAYFGFGITFIFCKHCSFRPWRRKAERVFSNRPFVIPRNVDRVLISIFKRVILSQLLQRMMNKSLGILELRRE
jgi:hypothetical protein